jgi:hypothetical protein
MTQLQLTRIKQVLHKSRLICVELQRQDNLTIDLRTRSPLRESEERSDDLLIVDPVKMKGWNRQ